MDVVVWMIAVSVIGAAATAVVVVVRARAAGGQEPPPARQPIVIQLSPEARLRLNRERGLSYTLTVDDAVEIRGLSFTQVAGVVRSFVDAHVPGRSAPSSRPLVRAVDRRAG
ncbi:MAG: hypothetical protein ACRD0G_12245 [Acidimicrobiales bacterium]